MNAKKIMLLEPYLSFNGACEEALAFYEAVFGGQTTVLHRYDRSPLAPQLPPKERNKVMHARFRSPGVRFMASDHLREYPAGSHVSLSIATDNEIEADRLYSALADGGHVSMSMHDAPWGGRFGMLTDRYGIDWLINCAPLATFE